MPEDEVVYAVGAELPLRAEPKAGARSTTTVLMGAWLAVRERTDDGWVRVAAFGEEGWVRSTDVAATDRTLKLFFIDVGQGDGVLVESPTARLLVDGGPGTNVMGYLAGWKYRWLVREGARIRLDAVVVSHFDADHFVGVTEVVDDPRFEVGTLLHNGIARFASERAARPDGHDTDLGTTTGRGRERRLLTSFSTLDDARSLLAGGGLMPSFRDFLDAAVRAHAQGRLGSMARLASGDSWPVPLGSGTSVEVLGPVEEPGGGFRWISGSSETRNGHSVVLRVTHRERRILLGGDLNAAAEAALLAHHGAGAFEVDVAKACHHGSSDFSVDFMRATRPYATVFSSGDNENYGHPQADALGAAGRHSRGDVPLVLSTELARATSPEAIHYGLINVRTDGTDAVVAHMWESRRSGDMWNSFTLP